MGPIQAGVSRVTITPPVGMHLIGFATRSGGAHSVRDDLYATALAFSDGVTEAVVVSCDLLIIHPDLVGRVRRHASAQTGVPGENIMLCATHSHSGPVTYAGSNSRPMDQAYAYVHNLAFLLSGSIKMAHDRLAPATLGFGRGQARIGINRRLTRPDGTTVIAANPDGPLDPEIGVLRVDAAQGQPMAVVVNYACHPVVLGAGSNVISADWPGTMRRVVERATGGMCLFIQGACADINPLPGAPSDQEDLERLGIEIGGEAIAAWARIEPQPAGRVVACRERLFVPLLPSLHGDKRPQLVEMAREGSTLNWDELHDRLNALMPWMVEVVGTDDERRVAMELQAIRVGDTTLVSAGGEIFVETGLAVKRRSPMANVMFAAYTNGCVGYLPLPEDYARGGYEVEESYLFYRLPAPIAPQAAGLVEETALRLLSVVS